MVVLAKCLEEHPVPYEDARAQISKCPLDMNVSNKLSNALSDKEQLFNVTLPLGVLRSRRVVWENGKTLKWHLDCNKCSKSL